MENIIALFIKYLPYLVKVAPIVPEIMDYIQKTRDALSQTKEWDQATEDAFNAEIKALTDNPPPWWKPEA